VESIKFSQSRTNPFCFKCRLCDIIFNTICGLLRNLFKRLLCWFWRGK